MKTILALNRLASRLQIAEMVTYNGPGSVAPLPDNTLVVRGGRCLPENFAEGSGATVDPGGLVQGVSVNAAAGLSVPELTALDPKIGYPGIPHNQVGVTTVGKVRALGGDVVRSPREKNPHHATLSGLSPDQASSLFRPTVKNPNRTR